MKNVTEDTTTRAEPRAEGDMLTLRAAAKRVSELYAALGRIGAADFAFDGEDLCELLGLVRRLECDVLELQGNATAETH
jgi:hypothetical protein